MRLVFRSAERYTSQYEPQPEPSVLPTGKNHILSWTGGGHECPIESENGVGVPDTGGRKFCHECTPARVGKPSSKRRWGWVQDSASLIALVSVGTVGASDHGRGLVGRDLVASLRTARVSDRSSVDKRGTNRFGV